MILKDLSATARIKTTSHDSICQTWWHCSNFSKKIWLLMNLQRFSNTSMTSACGRMGDGRRHGYVECGGSVRRRPVCSSVGVVGHKQRLLGCGASVSGRLVLALSCQAVVLQREGESEREGINRWVLPGSDTVQTELRLSDAPCSKESCTLPSAL